MDVPRYFSLTIPCTGVLVIRAEKDYYKRLEIRGSYDVDLNSPFQRAIDGLQSGHVSGLFSCGTEVVHKNHPSWIYVCNLWEEGHKF